VKRLRMPSGDEQPRNVRWGFKAVLRTSPDEDRRWSLFLSEADPLRIEGRAKLLVQREPAEPSTTSPVGSKTPKDE
jgi:hypothetical protein